MNKIPQRLTREQVSANRKSEVFIGNHCYICNRTYTNVPQWKNHKVSVKHKEARTKLLAQLICSESMPGFDEIFGFARYSEREIIQNLVETDGEYDATKATHSIQTKINRK